MLVHGNITGRIVTALPALALAGATLAWAAVGAAQAPGGSPQGAGSRVLTLDEAIRLARGGNPTLGAAGLAFDASRSRARDAGRLSNPALTAGVENVGGDLGTRFAETSVLLEQSFELGGDRSARSGVAEAAATASQARSWEIARVVEAETVERFCDAWLLQERVKRLGEAVRIADRAVEAAGERVRAGAAPAFERARAMSFRSLRELDLRRAGVELEIARRSLALQWGADSAAFDSLLLPDPALPALPPLDRLQARLGDHPSHRRAAAERAVEGWRVREARAANVPDVQLGAGVRHLADEGTGLAAGLTVPLPLWGQPRAAVGAAESDHAAALARERQVARELRLELEGAYRRLVSAVSTWEDVRERIRPAAEEALVLIGNGYRSGRLGFLEIQEGQRSLLEADVLMIESSADVWRARKRLEGLMGVGLEELAPSREDR